MSLKNDAFPSSAAFDLINGALQNEADRKDAVNNAKAIFGFTLKNTSGQTESWHIDLKNKGSVGKGVAPEGGKADVLGETAQHREYMMGRVVMSSYTDRRLLAATLTLSDADFAKMVDGKAKAQQLFMAGKLKIKGNMMKATKLEPIMAKAQNKAKL
ncbi:MAG: hypothetical protein MMC23_006163 [Stictis urceolatum]|nr:hypothetical protein [Stictis urceolata]